MNEPRLMFRQLASRLAGGLARQFGQFPSGVCGIASPESGPVVEFVVLGSRRPAHSGVELRMVPAHPGTLVAELEQHGVCAPRVHRSGRFSSAVASGPARTYASRRIAPSKYSPEPSTATCWPVRSSFDRSTRGPRFGGSEGQDRLNYQAVCGLTFVG